jgi:flagellar assembly protein FliH
MSLSNNPLIMQALLGKPNKVWQGSASVIKAEAVRVVQSEHTPKNSPPIVKAETYAQRLLREHEEAQRLASAPELNRLHDQERLNLESERLAAWESRLIEREKDIRANETKYYKAAQEEGIRVGYESGWASAQVERDSLTAATQSVLDHFLLLDQKIAPMVMDIAVEAAQTVVHDSTRIQTDLAQRLVRKCVDDMRLKSDCFVVSAHPDTLAVLDEHMKSEKKESLFSGMKLVADEAMERGGFVLSHDNGWVDQSIEARWLAAMNQLSGAMAYEKAKFEFADSEAVLERKKAIEEEGLRLDAIEAQLAARRIGLQQMQNEMQQQAAEPVPSEKKKSAKKRQPQGELLNYVEASFTQNTSFLSPEAAQEVSDLISRGAQV